MLCLGTVHAEFLAEYIFSPGWRERLVRVRGSWPQGKAAVRANRLLQEETPGQLLAAESRAGAARGWMGRRSQRLC